MRQALFSLSYNGYNTPTIAIAAKIPHCKDTNNQKNMLTSCDIYAYIRPYGLLIQTYLTMNVFDIIVYIALAWAVFNGWRRGFLLQMMSLVAVIAALFLSVKYCTEVGTFLGVDGSIQKVVGFIVIFAVTLILLTIFGYLLRKVFRFAGLGVVDILLGILFSVLKVGVIVSALFAWFAAVNKDYDWASKQTIEESRWFTPISGVVDKLTPYFEVLKSEIFE